MKSTIITFAIALLPLLSFGQQEFEKFENADEITSCVISKKAFSMLGSVKMQNAEPDAARYQELIKKVESFQAYVSGKTAQSAEIKTAGELYVRSSGMEELLRVKEKGANVKMMVKSKGETRISEVLFLVEHLEKENSAVLVLIKGDFDLNELAELTSKVIPQNNAEIGEKLSGVNRALDLRISPNPVTETFYINTEKPAKITIYDLSGRLVKSATYEKSGMSVSGLQPATYVVEISIDDKKQTQQIIVK